MRPLHGVSIVRVLQLVDDDPQRKDLLVDLDVGLAGVHGDLGVLLLAGQAVVDNPLSVGAPRPPVPAVLLHRALAGPDLRVLAHDVWQFGPEALATLDAGENVVDEVVEVGAGVLGSEGLVDVGVVPEPAGRLPPA